jgi:hypothetical protein
LTTLAIVLLAGGAAWADAPRTHDGLFLRVGAGVGGLSMTRSGSVAAGSSAAFLVGDSRIGGGTGAFELTVGGALRPGVILAGSFASQNIANPVLERDGDSDVSLDGPLAFVQLGLLLDVYPDPRGGFHLGGSASFAGAWVKSPPPRFTDYLGGGGGALALHAGYSWWVSDDWAIGLLARASAARLHGEDTQFGITGAEDDRVTAFALMVAATFN